MNNRILVDCFSWGRLLFIVRIIMVLGGGLTLGGCTIPEASQRVALVYGVADYPPLNDANPDDNDLSAPTNDAANMAALFTRQGYTVTQRTDSNVTKAAILSDIKNLQGFSGLVVLYFSG
ncbi:MAG: caspase family protein, partial [Breznakiellaceae bacterium]